MCTGSQQQQQAALLDDSSAAVKQAAHAMGKGVATGGNDGSDASASGTAAQHSTGVQPPEATAGVDTLAVATREAKAVAEAGALWRRDYQTLIKHARQLVARREQLAWKQASVAAWCVLPPGPPCIMARSLQHGVRQLRSQYSDRLDPVWSYLVVAQVPRKSKSNGCPGEAPEGCAAVCMGRRGRLVTSRGKHDFDHGAEDAPRAALVGTSAASGQSFAASLAGLPVLREHTWTEYSVCTIAIETVWSRTACAVPEQNLEYSPWPAQT